MDRNSSAGLRLWAIILATAATLGMLAGPAAAQARRIIFSPSDPIVQQSVTFRAENFPNNQIRWDFDDGTPLICQSTIITHTYSRTGTFLVKAKSWCGDDAVTTTVSVTVRSGEAKGPLAPFKISFIQLRFQDGKSYQTVARNAKLKALADIKYEGTGVLQGGWVVDGNSFKQFSQSLAYARSAVIDSGDVQGLPTQEPGRHEVTLRISSPAYDALLPVIRYTVESEEEKPDLRRPKEPEPLHIAGSVQYRHRRRPVAGAAVEYRVYDPKARSESSRGIAVLTDNLGRFIITGVKADSNFRLHIYGRDFRSKVQEGAISDKSIDQLAVVVEDVAGGIRLGGLVSYFWAKTPAAEMNVVYHAFEAKTNSLDETSKKTTVTDDKGRFDFFGIPPGSAYALEISSPSHAPETFRGKGSAESGGDLSLEIHRQPAVNEVTPTIPAAGNVVTIKGFDLTWPTAGSGPGQIFLELDERTFMVEKVLGWDMGRIDFVLPDKIVDGEYLVKVSQEDGTVIASFKLTCQRKPYEISVEDFKITGCRLLDWEKSLFHLEAEGTLKNSGSRTFSDSLIFKLQENALFKKQAQEKIDIASGQSVTKKWTFTDFQFAEGNRHDFTIQVMTDPQKSDIYKLDDQENNISQLYAYNPQPRIENFSGRREGETSVRQERLYISWGEKVTLSWKTSGAQQVGLSAAGWRLDGLAAEGSLEVRPDAAITYTLSASFSKQFTEQSTLTIGVSLPTLIMQAAGNMHMKGGLKNELFFALQPEGSQKLTSSDLTILVEGVENGNDQVGKIIQENNAVFYQAPVLEEKREINVQAQWKPSSQVTASLTFTILPVYDFKPAEIQTFTADGQSEFLLLDGGKSVLYRWQVVIPDTLHTALDRITIEKSVASPEGANAAACQFKESPKVILETTELQGEISDIAEYCPPSGFFYTLRVYSHDKYFPQDLNEIKSRPIAVAPWVYSMSGEGFVLLGNAQSLGVTYSKPTEGLQYQNVNDFDWTINGLAPKDAEQAGLGALVSSSEHFLQYNAPLGMPSESNVRIEARHKTNGAQVVMIMRLDERLRSPYLAPGGDWYREFCISDEKKTLCEYEETGWSDTWFALRGRAVSICANPTNTYYKNLRIGWQIIEGEGEMVSGNDPNKRGATIEDAPCVYFTSHGDWRLVKIRIWLLDYPKITPTELCISICREIAIDAVIPFTPDRISPDRPHLTINGSGFTNVKEIIIGGKTFKAKEFTVRQLSNFKIEMEFSPAQFQSFDDSKLNEPIEMTSTLSALRVKSLQKLRISKQ